MTYDEARSALQHMRTSPKVLLQERGEGSDKGVRNTATHFDSMEHLDDGAVSQINKVGSAAFIDRAKFVEEKNHRRTGKVVTEDSVTKKDNDTIWQQHDGWVPTFKLSSSSGESASDYQKGLIAALVSAGLMGAGQHAENQTVRNISNKDLRAVRDDLRSLYPRGDWDKGLARHMGLGDMHIETSKLERPGFFPDGPPGPEGRRVRYNTTAGSAPVDLAHELGHASTSKGSELLKRLAAGPSGYARRSLLAPLLVGGASGAVSDHEAAAYVAPAATAALLSAPNILEEGRAWNQGAKGLAALAESSGDLLIGGDLLHALKKVRRPALASYLALPAAGAALGTSAHFASKGTFREEAP